MGMVHMKVFWRMVQESVEGNGTVRCSGEWYRKLLIQGMVYDCVQGV